MTDLVTAKLAAPTILSLVPEIFKALYSLIVIALVLKLILSLIAGKLKIRKLWLNLFISLMVLSAGFLFLVFPAFRFPEQKWVKLYEILILFFISFIAIFLLFTLIDRLSGLKKPIKMIVFFISLLLLLVGYPKNVTKEVIRDQGWNNDYFDCFCFGFNDFKEFIVQTSKICYGFSYFCIQQLPSQHCEPERVGEIEVSFNTNLAPSEEKALEIVKSFLYPITVTRINSAENTFFEFNPNDEELKLKVEKLERELPSDYLNSPDRMVFEKKKDSISKEVETKFISLPYFDSLGIYRLGSPVQQTSWFITFTKKLTPKEAEFLIQKVFPQALVGDPAFPSNRNYVILYLKTSKGKEEELVSFLKEKPQINKVELIKTVPCRMIMY